MNKNLFKELTKQIEKFIDDEAYIYEKGGVELTEADRKKAILKFIENYK